MLSPASHSKLYNKTQSPFWILHCLFRMTQPLSCPRAPVSLYRSLHQNYSVYSDLWPYGLRTWSLMWTWVCWWQSHYSVHFGHPLFLLLHAPPLHFQSGQADCLCGSVCLKKERGKEDRRHRGRRNWGFLSTQGSVCFCNEVSYLLRLGALEIRSMCVI